MLLTAVFCASCAEDRLAACPDRVSDTTYELYLGDHLQEKFAAFRKAGIVLDNVGLLGPPDEMFRDGDSNIQVWVTAIRRSAVDPTCPAGADRVFEVTRRHIEITTLGAQLSCRARTFYFIGSEEDPVPGRDQPVLEESVQCVDLPVGRSDFANPAAPPKHE